MIYVTGDKHGDFIDVFNKSHMFKKEDILIVLGDSGINYYGNGRDIKLKNKLFNRLPCKLFIIRGNHENRPSNINSYQLCTYFGGSVYVEQEYPNLIFAVDGETYSIEGKTFAVLGGAYSVDKFYRIERGWKWFEDEQPNDKDKKYLIKNLEKLNWKVDYMLTHTAPYRHRPTEWFLSMIDQSSVDESTEIWLDSIEDKLDYKKWILGHYHGEKADGRFRFMFNNIIPLEYV